MSEPQMTDEMIALVDSQTDLILRNLALAAETAGARVMAPQALVGLALVGGMAIALHEPGWARSLLEENYDTNKALVPEELRHLSHEEFSRRMVAELRGHVAALATQMRQQRNASMN